MTQFRYANDHQGSSKGPGKTNYNQGFPIICIQNQSESLKLETVKEHGQGHELTHTHTHTHTHTNIMKNIQLEFQLTSAIVCCYHVDNEFQL